ncbi:MAG: helix-turn-helix domain-containing protein [Lachnospiraceae bacterium]|nr:helix-turn-helix domain-containing protein [Lachnospiraceae bacterium]
MGNNRENAKEIVKYYVMHGVSLTQNAIPANYPPHWHSAAEFTVVLKEGIRYQIGNTVYRPHPGDILLVWPREMHSIINMPKRGSFFLQFDSQIIENNQDLVSASVLMTSLHLISTEQDPTLAKNAAEKMQEIRDCFVSRTYFAETRCKRLLYELLLMIGDHVISKNRGIEPDMGYSDVSFEYIRSACRYISEHSSEDISQAGVADTMGLSSSYFSRLFKKYTQRSFPEYLSEIRVQKAIHLLTQDNLSVTECAFRAGFQSITTFNKVFHDTTGYSPRDYRKLHTK